MYQARRRRNRLARASLAGKGEATGENRLVRHVYTVAGLKVVSDLPMPGLLPGPSLDGSADTADVTIARAVLPPAAMANAHHELNFEIADLMRMSMRHGTTILYDPLPDAPAEDMALYLGGTGFGALLHQRGMVLLHASAVRIGDAAVLFCGPSGAGKSTLAAALVEAGYDHVADDFCAISFAADGTPMVAPDGRRHKLWDSALDGLAAHHRKGVAVRSDMAKYYVDPHRTVATPLPIAAIFELAVGDQVAIEALGGLGLVRVMREHAYRPHLVSLMGQHRHYFDAAAAIAKHSCTGQLIRPLQFEMMKLAISAVEEYLDQQ